ncbi:co-chaperone DjlA [Candidatus Pacearchaeota archaeon]|nr:co-chaperone DjlA [Candidatus Pacearchaeota archaeon]
MGGFFGLLLGIYIGHKVDRHLSLFMLRWVQGKVANFQGQIQQVFFESTFLVMGHLAKSDGRVSEEEIQLARQVMQRMNLGEDASREAMALFSRGKEPDFDLEAQLQTLRKVIFTQRQLIQMFIEIQISAGYADGSLDAAERSVLFKICESLGFTRAEFDRLDAMIRAGRHSHQPESGPGLSIEDAYAILNIDASASDAEVKKAYRRLMNQHHPDKLASKGLPKEMMKLAEEKTIEIRSAYERVRSVRGFK